MKKLLTVVVCILLAVSLVACGSPAEPAAPSEDAATQAPAAEKTEAAGGEAPAGEAVELSVTSWRTDDLDAWNAINAEFNKAYPNIKVTFDPVTATEYDSVLMTSLQSGNADDIIFLRTWGSGKQIYDAGYVIELTEEDIPNLSVIPDTIKAAWQNDDGVSYGVPGSICYGGFFYNKGIFEECGVEVPKTWDEFMSACATIAEKGYTPIAFGIKDSWMVAEYLSANLIPAASGGSAWHEKLMNKEVDFTDPAFVKHFEWMKEMAEYFPQGYEGIGYTDMQQLFLSEAAAIYPVGTFDLGYLESMNPDMNLGWFFMPMETEDVQQSTNFNAIMGYGINANLEGEKLEAAKTYLNWLADVDASQMFGNVVLGQYAVNPAATTLENPLSAEIASEAGALDLFWQIPYQKLSDQSPDYTTAISQAVYKLLVEGATPEEAAQDMQNSMAWYFA